MTHKISSYMQGAVKIKVQGENQERFMNLCMTKQMQLWGVRKLDGCVFIWLSLSDFFRIRDVVRKTEVKITVIDSYGFPFFIKRLKKRRIFLYGAVVFMIAIYILSSYIWFIDVAGLKNISAERIQHIIEANGLRVGNKKEEVKTKELEKEILLSIPEVAWVGIHFTGTRAIVEVVEKVTAEQEDKSPADLIASKAGIISECIPILGESKVAAGDYVNVGDVLIKGIGKNSEVIRAKGIVKARIQYESIGESRLEETQYTLTGNSEFGIKLNFCGNVIALKQANLNTFAAYEHEVIRKNLLWWRNHDFVVETIIDVYRELEANTIVLDEIEAEDTAAREALTENSMQIPRDAYVVSQKVTLLDPEEDRNLIRVKLVIETEELIGMYNQYNEE